MCKDYGKEKKEQTHMSIRKQRCFKKFRITQQVLKLLHLIENFAGKWGKYLHISAEDMNTNTTRNKILTAFNNIHSIN